MKTGDALDGEAILRSEAEVPTAVPASPEPVLRPEPAPVKAPGEKLREGLREGERGYWHWGLND